MVSTRIAVGSPLINEVLGQLDFHPLSITLLATVAHQNMWDANRLVREWRGQRTDMLHTKHNNSLATTIELSLTSPTFQELGPDAQGLLGVIAFFPQGIDENNLDWLFPTISNRANIFDSFCILSLTYRSNGFITMLAPLRDHLCPKDLALSPLLQTTKDHYFKRLSVYASPRLPGFEEAQWITSEDVNAEHLLDIFTSIDASTVSVWNTCAFFMRHLYWYKKRLVVLGPKIEGLPDNHPSKPQCLLQLSQLFKSVGNYVEYKRLLTQTLELQRGWGDDLLVAETLKFMSGANRMLGLYKDGIQQAKEALELYKQYGHILGQGRIWEELTWLFYDDKQLDLAEEAALQGIGLFSDGVHRSQASECYRILGDICHLRGKTVEAINHFGAALKTATPSNRHNFLFRIHCSLAKLYFSENKFDDAHTHIKHAKLHTTNDTLSLGCAMKLQAEFWYRQSKLEEAMSEALCAISAYEKIGAMKNAEECRVILQNIKEAMNEPIAPQK